MVLGDLMKNVLVLLAFLFVTGCNDDLVRSNAQAPAVAVPASETSNDASPDVQSGESSTTDEVGGFALISGSGSGSATKCWTCSRGAYRETVCSKEAANDLISKGWRCSLQ